MKYDTNENPVEVAGSKTDYNFEKNDLEVAGNTNKTKINKQENHYSETSNSNNSEMGLSQILWLILALILVIGVMLMMSRATLNKASYNMTIQDAVMSLGVI